jgi:hypothetical protein
MVANVSIRPNSLTALRQDAFLLLFSESVSYLSEKPRTGCHSKPVDDGGRDRALLAYHVDDLAPYHVLHAGHGLHQLEQP